MHLKGVRFGFPLVKRFGLLKHHETYRVTWNRHQGLEIHYVLKGDIAWELRGKDAPLTVSGGFFGISLLDHVPQARGPLATRIQAETRVIRRGRLLSVQRHDDSHRPILDRLQDRPTLLRQRKFFA